MAIKVVVTNLDFGQGYTKLFEEMKPKGFEMVWTPPDDYSPQETVRLVKGFDAVIAGGEKYDRWALDQLKDKLKLIVRHGTGVDNIDIDAATDLGIAVTAAPGRNARAVAEYALGMMLCYTRQVCRFDDEMHQGQWRPRMTKELYGKTVGIIGFGAIGKWLVTLLAGFNCRILVYDKYQQVDRAGVENISMDELLKNSDFVSLHIPLNPETENSIGTELFNKMKRSAVFVNTSRGKVVRENELIEALQKGIIAGACLDVFANAPIDKSNPLTGMDNVILSPHTSAVTEEAMEVMMDSSLTDLTEFFEGKAPSELLNPNYRH
jgi:D-3-phosphoglycerate dehydrogenase